MKNKHAKLNILFLVFFITFCVSLAMGCGGGNAIKMHVVWKVGMTGNVYAHRIKMVNDTLILANSDSLFSFSAINGSRIWANVDETSGAELFTTYGDKVYIPLSLLPGQNRCLIAELDLRTGKRLREFVIWTFESLGAQDDSVGVGSLWLDGFDVSDKYLFASAFGRLKAFDRIDRRILWERDFPGYGYTLIQDDIGFVGGDKLAAFNLATGDKIWARDIQAYGNLCVAKGLLIFGGPNPNDLGKSFLCAVDAKTGNNVWSCNNEEVSNLVKRAYDGRLFVCDEMGTLFCVDLATGKKLWSFKAGGSKGKSYYDIGVPAVAGGAVYFTAYDGYIYALDLETGKPIDRYYIDHGCPPETDGQYIYVQGGLHYLYKFKKIQKPH